MFRELELLSQSHLSQGLCSGAEDDLDQAVSELFVLWEFKALFFANTEKSLLNAALGSKDSFEALESFTWSYQIENKKFCWA